MSVEKHGLETGALTQFSDAMSKLLGEDRFAFHELRNPPEPDGFCLLGGQPLHVEVCHFYGTQSDAKQLLGRKGKSAPTSQERLSSSLAPLDARLLTPLNRLLGEKAKKTYQSQRVWLLIRSAFPLWNLDDFEAHKENIAIPEKHPFEQIWLLCGPHPSCGVLRLA